MITYYPELSPFLEVFAFCVNDQAKLVNDRVHAGHCYKVLRLVEKDGFEPYGLRLLDYNGNELQETFYLQCFQFIETILN